MKILSIGNSFSQDAQRWLHRIAVASGQEVDTYNLVIGGCSLEHHWHCIENNLCDYGKEGNDGQPLGSATVLDTLKSDTFDVITVQQASGHSGLAHTYVPYLTNIVEFIKQYQPNAKIYFHKTWSYDIGSNHGEFNHYNRDQQEMYRRITDATRMASKLAGVEIIPAGDVIQSLRDNTKEFDIKNGGLSLCCDGFHLSADYGRFAAAATWYAKLTEKNINLAKFAEMNPDFDIRLLELIVDHVNKVLAK